MDGTVLNTLEDLYLSVNFMLGEFSMPPRTREEIRSFVGNGIPKLIERSVPVGTNPELVKKCTDVMLSHYRIHCMDNTCPYDGIIPLLEKLKSEKIKTAIVTNKDESAAKKLVEDMFPGLVDVTIGLVPGRQPKPSPDGVLAALEILGSNKSESVYVGDSETDVMTAKNAGLPCIGCEWGFRDRKVLEEYGAEFIVSEPRDISGYREFISGG